MLHVTQTQSSHSFNPVPLHSFIIGTDRLHDDNTALLYSWHQQSDVADGDDDVMIMMRTTEYLVITSSLYGNNFIMCNFVVIFIAVVVVVVAIRQVINATIAV